MDSSASPFTLSTPTDQPLIDSILTNTAFNPFDQVLYLENIRTLLQPIYNLSSGEILGYEALTRGPEGTDLESPLRLFEEAEQQGKLSELELLCRKKSIQRFAELQLPGRLFINVSPNTLLDPDHPHGETVRLLEDVGLQLERVVIEITEGQVVDDEALLQKTIDHYRQLGFNIAIDDLGSGYSGLKQWSELSPDIVKIDRYFIDGCHQNPIKKEFLKSIVALARATQTLIVAEGVEQPQELQLICELGIDMVQGFLLAKPQSHPGTDSVAGKIRQHISRSHLSDAVCTDDVSTRSFVEWTGNDHAIGALATAQVSLTSDCRCEHARMIFSRDRHLNSLAVLDNKGKPLGLLLREKLTEVFSSRYGDALYAKKSVMKVMNLQPLVVDANESLDQVSQLITDSDYDMSSHIVVTHYGRYLGVVSMRQLLKKITEDKVSHARNANPLTLLPGNVAIEKAIEARLRDNRQFELAYFDLNHFKPFNDLYGYAMGDGVIKLLSNILKQCCAKTNNFVGHIGGDDFMVIFDSGSGYEMCTEVVEKFDDRCREFFHSEHLADGGYWAQGRDGARKFIPLLSLAVGLIRPEVGQCSVGDVSALAADAKKEAKQAECSQVVVLKRSCR